MLLEENKDSDDDLGRGSDEDLTETTALGVADGSQSVVQRAESDHFVSGDYTTKNTQPSASQTKRTKDEERRKKKKEQERKGRRKR